MRDSSRFARSIVLLGASVVVAFLVSAPVASQETSYRVGPSDLVSVKVLGIPDLTLKVRIGEDGLVSLPLIGTVGLGGLSVSEAESEIANRLIAGGFANEPQVSLFVEEMQSHTVTVQGAVRTPGTYTLMGSRTLLEVLGEAGGIVGRQAGGAGQMIYVLRQGADGEKERIAIDSVQLLDLGDPELDIPIVPGDSILVPHSQTEVVYVNGAVNKPGPVSFSSASGMTVLQAITAAGGGTVRARLGKVHILRRGPGGEERIEVDLKKITKGKSPDVPLEPNDVVVVNEWFL